MKISFELDAEFREDQGKGASRRLRHLGKVPAILYGGRRDARALLLDHTRLAQLMDNERFYSTIVALKVGSQSQAAVLKDVQRHPYKNQIMHIDFQRVLEDEKIRMLIPLHFKGGAESKGVKEQGGVLSHVRNDVEVTCLPKDLPEFVEVDVSGSRNQPGRQAVRPQAARGRRARGAAGRSRRTGRLHPHAARRGGGSSGRRRGRCCRSGRGNAGSAAAVRRSAGAPGAAPAGAAPGAAAGAAPAGDAKGAAKGAKDGKDAKKGDGKK